MSDDGQTKPGGFFKKLLGARETPAEGATGRDRKVLMHAAENFHILTVEDVMIPRAEITAIDDDTSLEDLAAAFKDAGHSRLPVYKESLDDPTGLVHVKDLLPYLTFDARGRNGKSYPDKKIVNKIKRPEA